MLDFARFDPFFSKFLSPYDLNDPIILRNGFGRNPPNLQKETDRRWDERLKKLQALESWYQTYPLVPVYRPRLTEPSPVWHTVYRQKHAFDIAATHPEDVHVFAFEAENVTSDTAPKGQRKYLVTTYQQLWHTIYHLADHGKHPSFYEVITEGSACKLYFDLEFSRALNTESNGAEMVQTFIEFVCEELHKTCQLQCDVGHVVNLDATTEAKFSRHLIFNLPQAVFKDNIQAGNFVHHVCHKILEICKSENQNSEMENESGTKRRKLEDKTDHGRVRASDSARHQLAVKMQKLFIRNKDGDADIFVDQGVYTRNRNFRLYKCIKFGKANPLLVADDNRYKPRLRKTSATGLGATAVAAERQFFLDSLITNISYCPSTRILTSEHDEEWGRKRPSQLAKNDNTETKGDKSELVEGFAHSPYPEIDDFVSSLITTGGVQGTIRRWVYFTQGQLIVYDIIKNRWCGNVQRQHKSNNVMILVDLRRGVYYQKCHDPVCRAAGYKSPDTPLPDHLLPSFGDDLDDDELLAVVTAAENVDSTERMSWNNAGLNDRDAWKTGKNIGESKQEMPNVRDLMTYQDTTEQSLQEPEDVNDDELLEATLQAENSFNNGTSELVEQRTSSSNCNDDITESDEELLSAVIDEEGHSTSFVETTPSTVCP